MDICMLFASAFVGVAVFVCVCMRNREFESDLVGIAVVEHDLSVVRVI